MGERPSGLVELVAGMEKFTVLEIGMIVRDDDKELVDGYVRQHERLPFLYSYM